MSGTPLDDLEEIARRALAVSGVQSAAVFFVAPGSSALQLATAAGIEGPALDGLAAAVRNPDHPVTRALTDEGPTFDVLPIAPGGPKLRSHLPLVTDRGETVGVLAVAHDSPLGDDQRAQLIELAVYAASAIVG
jgi:GAF domain-containing protein